MPPNAERRETSVRSRQNEDEDAVVGRFRETASYPTCRVCGRIAVLLFGIRLVWMGGLHRSGRFYWTVRALWSDDREPERSRFI
jgi:hypothetical protein